MSELKLATLYINGLASPGLVEIKPKVIRLNNWATCRPKFCDPYAAPEIVGLSLRGIATGHPRKPDGSRVITSRIVEVRGRFVKTESGNHYRLGEPSEAFLAYLKREGCVFDPEAPIKVVGK